MKTLPDLKKHLLCKISLLVVATMMGSFSASAQSVQVLGEFKDWSSFTANDGGGPICFAMSSPKETEPTPEGYGEAYIYLTHRPSQGLRNEFNLIAGYEFAPESLAIATVGSKAYELFTSADAAWLQEAEQSENFARDLRAGATLIIEGSSVAGISVVQTFSLAGATASSRAINSAC